MKFLARRKKIVVCEISGYPPDRGSGSETCVRILRVLQAGGLFGDIHVLAQCENSPKTITDGRLIVHRIWRKGSLRSLARVVKELATLRPDIVSFRHGYFFFGGAFFTALFTIVCLGAARVFGSKVCTTMAPVFLPDAITERFMRNRALKGPMKLQRVGLVVTTRLIALLSHRVITVTKEEAVILDQYYARVPKACVIGEGMDESPVIDRIAAKRSLGYSDREKLFMYFGFIEPNKNIETLLKAMAKVRTTRANCKLMIAGGLTPRLEETGRAYLQQLRDIAQQLSIGKDTCISGRYVSEDSLPAYFSACDILVLPYLQQLSFSGVYRRAVGYSKVVIASDAEFFRHEIKPGVNGILFRAGDSHDLAAKMIQLLDDEALYARIEYNVREMARSLSWEQVGKQVQDLFHAGVHHVTSP